MTFEFRLVDTTSKVSHDRPNRSISATHNRCIDLFTSAFIGQTFTMFVIPRNFEICPKNKLNAARNFSTVLLTALTIPVLHIAEIEFVCFSFDRMRQTDV
jgi:hypothetical protein